MVDIRVLIVEDHGIVGSGIAAALEQLDGITVVGVTTTLGEARDRLTGDGIDVVLADIELGDCDTLGLPAEIGSAGPAVLFLTMHAEPAVIRAAIDGGGAGYVSKDASLDDVATAIRTVAAGGTAFSRSSIAVARAARSRPSARELEVLTGVVAGEPNKVIAVRLGIGERTVESHVRRLFDRYTIESRTALALLAVTERWVRPD